MEKFRLFKRVFCLLLFTSSLFADPFFSWRAGYFGDFVFNRDMARVIGSAEIGSIEKVAYTTNGGQITLVAMELVDLFVQLGATDFSIATPAPETERQSFTSFSTEFSWAVGATAHVFKGQWLNLDLSGQYLYTRPRLTRYFEIGAGEGLSFTDPRKTPYREATVQGILFSSFTGPYGTAWFPSFSINASLAEFDLSRISFVYEGIPYRFFELVDERLWGYSVGLATKTEPGVLLRAEARFADVTALHLVAELAF